MERQDHYLKCETDVFRAIKSNEKKFEFRKNDRDFRVGDLVHLAETVDGIKTGHQLTSLEIKFILHGPRFGLPEGYCIFNW